MNVDQATFRAALLDADIARPDGLKDGQGRDAGRRFDVYRNNVAVALAEALETAFPVVAKLVGAANFKTLAAVFLRKHPPTSPLMMFYGAEMPAFLESFEPTSKIGYLPDVARVELALRESYHAADAEPVDPTIFQSLSPDALTSTKLRLAPSLRLIRSDWPIYAIWLFNSEDGAPKPAMAAENVVVLRPEMDPTPFLLPAGGDAFLSAIIDGATLGDAMEAATTASEVFDLSAMLALLIGKGAIVGLEEG